MSPVLDTIVIIFISIFIIIIIIIVIVVTITILKGIAVTAAAAASTSVGTLFARFLYCLLDNASVLSSSFSQCSSALPRLVRL